MTDRRYTTPAHASTSAPGSLKTQALPQNFTANTGNFNIFSAQPTRFPCTPGTNNSAWKARTPSPEIVRPIEVANPFELGPAPLLSREQLQRQQALFRLPVRKEHHSDIDAKHAPPTTFLPQETPTPASSQSNETTPTATPAQLVQLSTQQSTQQPTQQPTQQSTRWRLRTPTPPNTSPATSSATRAPAWSARSL